MFPTAFPQVAPNLTVGELFGPLGPIAVVAVLVALAVLVGVLVGESWAAARRRVRVRPFEATAHAAPSDPARTAA